MKKIKTRKKRIKMQKRFKLLFLCFLIVGLLGRIGDVEAGINDTVMSKNRLDGIYAVATVAGRERIFYLNMYEMNGRVAYCIELGKDVTTEIYHSTNDFMASYLSQEQIEYIRSISYFGYQYVGHDNYFYYMAAQEIIWEYLSNIDVEWTNVLDVNGERINIDFYKREILNLRNYYYNQASLNWEVGRVYSQGEKIVLSDSTFQLPDYEIVSSGHMNASIVGNKLYIETSNDYVGIEEITLRKKNYYDYDSLLYYYDNSQKLISNGNYTNIEIRLSFHVIGDNMKIQVVDKDTGNSFPIGQASLGGAVYELYNANHELVGTYETDINGLFEVSNLSYGTYYFKQIKASRGYVLSDEEVQVQFSKDNKDIILSQQVIYNVVEIMKVYGSVGNYVPEERIIFEITDVDGFYYSDVMTNSEGIGSIRLPYGTYTFTQFNTKWGYHKVDPFVVEVVELKDDKVTYNLINDLIQCRLRIRTFEQNNGEQLFGEGTTYRIREKNNDEYIEFEGKTEFVADEDGVLELPMLLSYGDYVLEQVDVPRGIFLNSESIEISINEGTQFELFNDELWVSYDVYNQLIMGKLEVLADKEVFYFDINDYGYKEEVRNGSKFLLLANQDIIINGKTLYQEGEEIKKIVTNEEGLVVVENLYLGDYCLVDIDTDKKECFSLESISNKVDIVEKKLQITEVLDKSDIQIVNKDKFGQGIKGSIFEVYKKGGEVIYIGSTNDEGIILVKDLVHDEYCIKQKSMSGEFQLLKDDQCISLNKSQVVEFVNKKKEIKIISVPDTFSDGYSWFFLVNLIGLIGMVVLVYKKIFANH